MRRTPLSVRRIVLAIAIPLLAFAALASWSLSSPVAATPDDDFHLPSIWCGLGERPGLCENPEDDPVTRSVPTAITTATCYAFHPEESGGCWNGEAGGMSQVKRANADRLYPPVFYATMSIFASENIAASVMAMRLFNCAFSVGLLSLVFFVLPRALRPALVVSALATAVPLGLFIYGSTNPSTWAFLSAATTWITLYGAFRTTGRQRWILSGLAVFGALIGAGARADAAVYAVFGALLAVLLGLRLRRSHLLPSATAGVIAVLSVAFYLSAWQGSSIVGGITSERLPLSGSQHLSNLLSAPSLWTGALGGWGLGWLDTAMPAAVSVLAAAVFWGAILVGFHRPTLRRVIAVVLAIAAMWLVPVVLLGQSRMLVGELIQPRYIVPLMIITVGVASARFDAESAWAGARAALAGAGLALANAIALHFNIQRYTTGTDQLHFDPGTNGEWWWAHAPSPLVTWIGGSLAFATMLALLWMTLPRTEAESWPEPGDSPGDTETDAATPGAPDGQTSTGVPLVTPERTPA